MFIQETPFLTSGQDGGVGGYALPPHTTKRRTTNLKTKNNQNCQKNQTYIQDYCIQQNYHLEWKGR